MKKTIKTREINIKNLNCRTLRLGILLRNRPEEGDLEVRNRNGRVLGRFCSHKDMREYGVTTKIRERFKKGGDFNGYGYLSHDRSFIYKFVDCSGAEQPGDDFCIFYNGIIIIIVHRFLYLVRELPPGTLVGFRTHRSNPSNGKPFVTHDLMPLSFNKPRLIQNIIESGDIGEQKPQFIAFLKGYISFVGKNVSSIKYAEDHAEVLKHIFNMDIADESHSLSEVVLEQLKSRYSKNDFRIYECPIPQKQAVETQSTYVQKSKNSILEINPIKLEFEEAEKYG